jgi:hypothetical protein
VRQAPEDGPAEMAADAVPQVAVARPVTSDEDPRVARRLEYRPPRHEWGPAVPVAAARQVAEASAGLRVPRQ